MLKRLEGLEPAYGLVNSWPVDDQGVRKVCPQSLLEAEQSARHAEESATRKAMVGSGDRSERIRTYNYPQNRVTDHRINLTLYDLGNIMDGDIQKIVDELHLVRNTEKLQEAGETF